MATSIPDQGPRPCPRPTSSLGLPDCVDQNQHTTLGSNRHQATAGLRLPSEQAVRQGRPACSGMGPLGPGPHTGPLQRRPPWAAPSSKGRWRPAEPHPPTRHFGLKILLAWVALPSRKEGQAQVLGLFSCPHPASWDSAAPPGTGRTGGWGSGCPEAGGGRPTPGGSYPLPK